VRPRVKEVKKFVADPLPKYASSQFKNFIITRKIFETILKSYHEVTKENWEHGYSHVGLADRTGYIILDDGRRIKWMIRPGGLAWLEFSNGKRLYLAKEKTKLPLNKK
jgi:hypothetical protein